MIQVTVNQFLKMKYFNLVHLLEEVIVNHLQKMIANMKCIVDSIIKKSHNALERELAVNIIQMKVNVIRRNAL